MQEIDGQITNLNHTLQWTTYNRRGINRSASSQLTVFISLKTCSVQNDMSKRLMFVWVDKIKLNIRDRENNSERSSAFNYRQRKLCLPTK